MSAKIVEIPSNLSVRDLAERVKVSPINIIRELMNNGVMANINQQIDYDTAAIVLQGLGFEPHEEKKLEEVSSEDLSGTLWNRLYAREDAAKLKPRPPVVTVMGHVDHGKTSLLDAIRHTDVVARRSGRHHAAHRRVSGRSQRTQDHLSRHARPRSLYGDARARRAGHRPGRAGGGRRRRRDAADQEAIAHAKAAHVPIIVALNKIDKPNANPERVKKELRIHGLLVIDEYGGDVLCIPVSAKKKQNIDDLLEAILLVADSHPDQS